MKPALYYAMVGGYYGRPSIGRLMAVTSEKGHQIYGRDVQYGNPTHRRCRDIILKFETEEKARAAMQKAEEAHDNHIGLVKAAERAAKEARDNQYTAMTDACKEFATKWRRFGDD